MTWPRENLDDVTVPREGKSFSYFQRSAVMVGPWNFSEMGVTTMLNRTLTILLFVLLCCFNCFGQMMYYRIKPGESTKRDVEQFLGQPLKNISQTLLEYKPRNERENYQVFVQYEKDTGIVEQIALVFREPQSREAILKSYVTQGIYYAPVKPEAAVVNAKGRLEEYFSQGLVLTHDSDTPASGVIRQAYYSDALFRVALKKPEVESREVGGGAESKIPPQVTGPPGMMGTIEGMLQMKNADGSVKPVTQATVNAYRIDLEGVIDTFQMKTDGKGSFVRFGAPGRATFVIVACAPGMQWTFVRNVRMGEKTVVPIIANSGDGTCPSKRDLIADGILPH